MVNNDMIKSMVLSGKSKEQEFAKCLMSQVGGEINYTNTNTDIYDHVDLVWIYKGTPYNIDVKGIKKNKRNEPLDENIHWIEIKNVHGYPGWLHGKADIFAFETQDYWVLVGKKKLQNYIYNKVDWSQEITDDNKSLYVLYQREFRLDVIVKVKTLDLMAIANKILKKYVID